MTELGPMQEKFEAWMENPLDLEKNADGKYLDLETCAYWITWQEAFEAGRSSLESERQAIMRSLSITFDAELGAEDQGYEAPAEPEPKYFATLAEAVEFEFKLVAGECDRLESENAELRKLVTEAEELFDLIGKFAGGDLTRIKVWREKARGAIRGGTNVEIGNG